MNLQELLQDKASKPKDKTTTIASWLLDKTLPLDELMAFAEKAKDSPRATCIEAIEHATKQRPELADENVLRFVTGQLAAKAPRIKWESARVIGNIAHLFPARLEDAIAALLVNSKHEGTVVRWSSAFALTEIAKLKTKHNTKLLPALEKALEEEEKGSIKKIYQGVLKKK